MAKKAPTKRVFQLAKELGVASKDVIAKCKAEEIPGITNHMSTVSLGLAQTITEWFGAESGGTAVQVAPPVDLEEARKRAAVKQTPATRKKAARKKAAPATEEPAAEAAETETEAEAPAPTPEKPVAPAPAAPAPPAEAAPPPAAPEPATDEPAPAEEPAAPAEVRPAAAASAGEAKGEQPSPEAEAEAQDKDAPKVTMNVPDRPQVIKRAGPMLTKPDQVKLSGPRVIRVEQPDVVPKPQPRARGGGSGVGARNYATGSGVGAPPDVPMSPRSGRGAGPASRRNKRRSASSREDAGRGGRTGAATGSGQGKSFNWREQDLLERERRLNRSGGFFRAARRDNLKRTGGGGQRAATAAESGGEVRVEEPITVKNLSAATGVKTVEILKKLLLAGQPSNINSVVPRESAETIMAEYDITLDVVEQKTAEEQIVEQFSQRDREDERRRDPVVTILGHVDHGKTSLLDCIRNANVAAGEAGGITQATSAFQVPVTVGDNEHLITFIDTPGHEAFTEMRSRGAKVTDVVVLVVAADDGIMPQTIESINHAKAAEVPIIVALNKIDKPEATDSNIQRILGQLAEHELNPVEWGGSTEVVRTSAIKKEGVQDLLEVIDYQAELLEIKADFAGRAEGSVLEAELAEGRGAVANVLVQEGRLGKGDFIVIGRAYGRVRDIVNDHGKRIDEAGPSMPVAISGLNEVPDAGDKFYVVKNLKEAEAAADERRLLERERDLATEKVTLDNIFQKLSEAGRKELPLIIKGDVQGSVDTLKSTLEKISTEDVVIAVKHQAVGGINEADILLAETTGAIIIGFNVTSSASARRAAEARGVDIRLYDVIYDITDDVTKAAEGLLEPEYKLEVLGHAEVRQVFKISKVGMIAGCYCTDGTIERNAQIRVTRDGIVVEKDRRLEQLKHFKDDVKEVRAGKECGMKIEGYNDIKEGDVLECYRTLEVRRSLS